MKLQQNQNNLKQSNQTEYDSDKPFGIESGLVSSRLKALRNLYNINNPAENPSRQSSNLRKKSILITAIFLTSCSNYNPETFKLKAIEHAKLAHREVHSDYLNCYALASENKRKCTSNLAAKYIYESWKQHQEYVQSFQFECEKLGFKKFLNSNQLDCKEIEAGPIFSSEKAAYIVNCKPQGQYLMRFDYETKEWNLVKQD